MKAAHTPGPWHAYLWDAASWEVDKGSPFIVEFSRTVDRLDELAANARVIRSAPDMLAALKAINDRINSLAQDGNKKPHANDIRDWQRWSAAAIAKAEGQS